MSHFTVQCRHDPRTCFPLPPKKRMRTQNPATNTKPSPPPMNQVSFMPFSQGNPAQVKVASRRSHVSVLPVPPGHVVVADPRRPYPVPGPQCVMRGHANATRTEVWPTSGNPTPPGPVWQGNNGVVTRTEPVVSGHVHVAAMCAVGSNPDPNKSLMFPQNGVLPAQIQVFPPVSSRPNSVPGPISWTNQQPPSPEQQTLAQDSSIGLEFDHAKLKIRYESVIKSLYADIPRQCTTCGMRFKTKEDHSHHMDWHVRKNRDARISKQKKQMFSRKYFLTSKLWLIAAEAIGTATRPAFFDNIKDEKKHEESCDILADESQKECPLCLEPFDEYFSNKTNDWMYREAVCFNPAKTPTTKMYRSLIGRIVHAKCVST